MYQLSVQDKYIVRKKNLSSGNWQLVKIYYYATQLPPALLSPVLSVQTVKSKKKIDRQAEQSWK